MISKELSNLAIRLAYLFRKRKFIVLRKHIKWKTNRMRRDSEAAALVEITASNDLAALHDF